MREFEILARGLFRPDQLIITYNPALRMPSSPAIQQWMGTYWEQKLAEAQERGIPLFDAPLYRFVDAETRADGVLHLTLGDTGYKEYVTTRVPEFSRGRLRQELGNALAVCSVRGHTGGHAKGRRIPKARRRGDKNLQGAEV